MMKLFAIAITSWCFLHTVMGASTGNQILQPLLEDSLTSEDGLIYDYPTRDVILSKYFPDPEKRNKFWEELEPAVKGVLVDAAKEAVALFMVNERHGVMPDCPESEGFFKLPGSTQCYKALVDQTRSWSDAGEQCKSVGLVLAEPENPIQIRKHLNDKYGGKYYWLGGRGTGSSVQFQRGGGEIYVDDSLSATNGHGITNGHCLAISAYDYHLSAYHSSPYLTFPCSRAGNAYALSPLCEV